MDNNTTIRSIISDDSFYIVYENDNYTVSFSGAYNRNVFVYVSESLEETWDSFGGIDSLVPCIVEYDQRSRSYVVEMAPGENFFEQDFSMLNQDLFGIESGDFQFELT